MGRNFINSQRLQRIYLIKHSSYGQILSLLFHIHERGKKPERKRVGRPWLAGNVAAEPSPYPYTILAALGRHG